MAFTVKIGPEVAAAAPQLKVLVVEAHVTNAPTHPELQQLIREEMQHVHDTWPMDQIKNRPAILATRAAYKALGKDPNRYRPSAEALCRRAVKGNDLYYISNLVDLINLISLRTGHSIGGFDADKIQGEQITLGRGTKEEDFEGIGRGPLNIDGLPVYRDAIGGIGTPTSDNERTKLSLDTTHLLMTVNIYGDDLSDSPLEETIADLLHRFAGATALTFRLVTTNPQA